jgi:hypothetical protein
VEHLYSNDLSISIPTTKTKATKMAISWEGNQESTLTTNTQEKRQRGGADDVDIQQVDRGNSGH